MTFNSSKCVLLRVSRSVNDVDFSYEMMGRPLESVESHKYLGDIEEYKSDRRGSAQGCVICEVLLST